LFLFRDREFEMADRIVTANRLDDGLVVYLNGASGGAGWSGRIGDARVARAEEDAAALLAEAEGPGQAVRVVDPYLIEVTRAGAVPRPVSHREAIRARGPTVRPDLGQQAEEPNTSSAIAEPRRPEPHGKAL
jgi:hypothetical protein